MYESACYRWLHQGALGARSPVPSGLTVMMGVTMVGDLLFNAFTHDELLAKHLAGSFTTTVHCSVDSCLVSGLEVVIAGISKCMVKTTEVQ